MVGAKDANLLVVIRAHRVAPIFARHMEEANVACGAIQAPTLELVALPASALQEAKKACVFNTIRCWMTIVSMGVEHWVRSVLSTMPLLMEMVLQTLKQAGTSFSCIL